MIKQTIEISSKPTHLRVRNGQLQIEQREDESKTTASVPCEDIGILVVDQVQTTYTHSALTTLAESGAIVLVCGQDHLPVGMLLPLAEHTEVVWRIAEQIDISKPLQKQLWRQLVQAKIRAQAKNLPENTPQRTRLLNLAQRVRSGDPSNMEAQAAKVYWSAWLEENHPFRRDPDGKDPLNSLLNYGYAVLRAAVARAVVCAGLLPAIGLHHANRSNAFCLADDLMEPLRPLVDARVRSLYGSGCREIDPAAKQELLGILTQKASSKDGATGPLMVSLQRMVASLVHCFEGNEKEIDIPTAVDTCESCN
ncbi:MAG TPA: type II CRISPR-associated endonuclease Cas1 [bacterium]|nr:type II CRISPR-associated endonuclease Cas1 [bacterium]HQL63513.1 type II CRISPR-associated endonuclease Cas1 [bacterium]